ncbi:NmrA family NAD(P)-binding protein [Streptomyces mexicanus]|uniref:NmrA family NAD(P)-binding protein n=1 Tax=Streptomyces mexicanus TaxID=178566 RepID=UPI003653B622
MILVTGATGTIGRHVVDVLSRTRPVRALVHDRQAPWEGAPVQVVRGDYADPRTLAAAMDGVRAVLVVTNDPLRPGHDAGLVTAAAAAGVRHLVKLSALAVTDPDADDLITRWQREAEDRIRASGMAWTFLRPRAFMSNALSWARSVRHEGVVRAPFADAPNATVDPRDVAHAAVRVLTEPGHEGRAYALTGPEPLTPLRQTEILAEVLGRPLRFVELSREEHLRRLAARHPEPVAEALVRSAERQLAGAKGRPDDTLPRLLGRPARTYRRWAEDHADAFAPAAAEGEPQ